MPNFHTNESRRAFVILFNTKNYQHFKNFNTDLVCKGLILQAQKRAENEFWIFVLPNIIWLYLLYTAVKWDSQIMKPNFSLQFHFNFLERLLVIAKWFLQVCFHLNIHTYEIKNFTAHEFCVVTYVYKALLLFVSSFKCFW